MLLLQAGTGSQERNASDKTRFWSFLTDAAPIITTFDKVVRSAWNVQAKKFFVRETLTIRSSAHAPRKKILLNVLISHRWQWHSQKKQEQFGCTSIRSFKFYCSRSRNSSVGQYRPRVGCIWRRRQKIAPARNQFLQSPVCAKFKRKQVRSVSLIIEIGSQQYGPDNRNIQDVIWTFFPFTKSRETLLASYGVIYGIQCTMGGLKNGVKSNQL